MSGLDLVPPAPGCGLRPFQEEALERVPTSLAGDRRPLLALPTVPWPRASPLPEGSPRAAAELFPEGIAVRFSPCRPVPARRLSPRKSRGCPRQGQWVMFCVPALELIEQTIESFRQQGITDIGVIQRAHPMTNYAAPVRSPASRPWPVASSPRPPRHRRRGPHLLEGDCLLDGSRSQADLCRLVGDALGEGNGSPL